MQLNITNLKKGALIVLDNEPYRVVEYNQKVMGRGGSIVNVKVKSLISGRVLDKTFKGNDQIESADITTEKVQFLYAESVNLHFMNQENFEQFEISSDLVGELIGFIKEGDIVQLQFFNGKPISVELPKNVQLRVEYTEEAVRGDTSSSITKDARLETGITIKVPAFIKQGDLISVDTISGIYRERVKN